MAENTKGTVDEYAEAMEATLQKPQNKVKPHWGTRSIPYLLNRLQEEMVELRNAYIALREVEKFGPPCSDADLPLRKHLQEEATDVANFSMMIWDNIRNGHIINQ